MKKQDSQQRVGVGVSSVLMILVVLAMTALSLLAFGSARSNESMTRRNADVGVAYYLAADQAQRKLAEVDAVLLEGAAENADLGWYQAQELEGVEWLENEEGLCFTFTTDAAEGHAVYVRGVVTDGPQRFRIAEHLTIDSREAFDNNYLVLMGD